MHLYTALTYCLLPIAALSLPWDGPKPTPVKRHLFAEDNTDWSPAPTRGPQVLARDDLGATCGFLSGSTSSPWQFCTDPTAICAHDSVHNVFGCCDTVSACQIFTSCIPQSRSATCDSECLADPFVINCDASFPYCNYDVLSYGIGLATSWYCNNIQYITTWLTHATDGNQSTIAYAEVTEFISTTSSSSSTSSKSSSSSPSTTTFSSSSSAGSPTASSLSTPTPTSSPALSPTPIGAIIGGVISGLAIIGAVVVLVVYLLRRNSITPASAKPGFYPSGPSPPSNTSYSPVAFADAGTYNDRSSNRLDSFHGSPQGKDINQNNPPVSHQHPSEIAIYSPPVSPASEQQNYTDRNASILTSASYPQTRGTIGDASPTSPVQRAQSPELHGAMPPLPRQSSIPITPTWTPRSGEDAPEVATYRPYKG